MCCLTVCSSPGHETISEYVKYHTYPDKHLFMMFFLEKFNVFDLLSGKISERVDLKIILFCNSVLELMFPLLEYHSI